MDKALAFLKAAGVFYVATLGEGKPHVRPFGALIEFDEKIYLCTNAKKAVYKQMIENPNIELSATDRNGDWIRIAATIVDDSSDAAKEAMWNAYENVREIYKGKEQQFRVLYLRDATATITYSEREPETFSF